MIIITEHLNLRKDLPVKRIDADAINAGVDDAGKAERCRYDEGSGGDRPPQAACSVSPPHPSPSTQPRP
jgi:hypothetical protein